MELFPLVKQICTLLQTRGIVQILTDEVQKESSHDSEQQQPNRTLISSWLSIAKWEMAHLATEGHLSLLNFPHSVARRGYGHVHTFVQDHSIWFDFLARRCTF